MFPGDQEDNGMTAAAHGASPIGGADKGKKSIELDIPTDPAERVRRQDEYNRMKAPLPAWLGPDTPERRMQLQMFVETIAAQDAADELGKCPECGLPYCGGDGSWPHCCDCAEPISADENDASPAVLRAMLHLARLDASRAEAELDELKNLAPAHRAVVPVVTMTAIADAVVRAFIGDKMGNPEAWGVPVEIRLADLHKAIMQAFDKELG